MIIGKVKFIVEYTSLDTGEKLILSTLVDFEDSGDTISYSYSLRDSNGNLIGGKGRGIYKKLIGTADPLEFAINHATYSMNNFIVQRKRILKSWRHLLFSITAYNTGLGKSLHPIGLAVK